MHFEVDKNNPSTVVVQIGNTGSGDIDLHYLVPFGAHPTSPVLNAGSAQFVIPAGQVNTGSADMCNLRVVAALKFPTGVSFPVTICVIQNGNNVPGYDDTGNRLHGDIGVIGSGSANDIVQKDFFLHNS